MTDLWHFDPDLVEADQPVTGFDVMATDKSVGTVVETVHDDELSFLVVDAGGRLTSKQVAIPARLVRQINAAESKVFLRVDKATVKGAPEYEAGWRTDQAWRDQAIAYLPELST